MTMTVEAPEDLDAPVVDVDDAAAGDADEDPDAPYGRNPRTGKPYQRPPEWRAKMADALARGRVTQSSGKPPARKAVKKPASAGATDYRPAIAALLQIPATALAMLGRHKPAFALDSATIQLHTPMLANAIHETAVVDDRVAAILDRALAAGPYGALLGALIPVALQIAANHGRIPAVAEMGIMTPEQLVAALDAR